jgi:tetratricopeptide (TPR) repeat protein
VVDALALPLGAGDASPTPAAPHDARAYELYLRGNELARAYEGLPQARELYQRAIDLDPRFAPAWAQLGRCHRVIGKYIQGSPDSEARAEEAFRRALELSPRLSVAQKFYAQLEADMGRGQQAVVRLLREADRHGNDPELFAGLVHACRYCGLFEESIAAHEEARRLDPNVPTGVEQTFLMQGGIEWLLSRERLRVGGGGDDVIRVIALGLKGRRQEARERLESMPRGASNIAAFRNWTQYLMSWLDRRANDMASEILRFSGLRIMEDPEAMFQEGWLLCDVGELERGLAQVRNAVAKGYFVAATLAESPAFDALRGDPAFAEVQARAAAGREQALVAFREAGGERLLGLTGQA